jgi:hypothetical protein
MHPFMVAWQHVCHHLSVSQHHSNMCPPTFGVAKNRSFSHTFLRHQRGILYHCLELLSVASAGSLWFFTSVQATTYFILASQVIKYNPNFEITPRGWSETFNSQTPIKALALVTLDSLASLLSLETPREIGSSKTISVTSTTRHFTIYWVQIWIYSTTYPKFGGWIRRSRESGILELDCCEAWLNIQLFLCKNWLPRLNRLNATDYLEHSQQFNTQLKRGRSSITVINSRAYFGIKKVRGFEFDLLINYIPDDL